MSVAANGRRSTRDEVIVSSRIHPTAVVGDEVELGEDVVVGPHSVLVGPLKVGKHVWIGPSVSIGTPAEYRGGPHPVGWDGECDGAGVIIDSGTIVREFVTINQGTERTTRVGPECYLMARSHVGHDCLLESEVTLTSAVQLAGHVEVGRWANIGMGTVIHQRCVVGPGAMVGMGSSVRQTISPFTITVGNPARTVAINTVGLERRGCSPETIALLEPILKARSINPEEIPASLPSDVRSALLRWAESSAASSSEAVERRP